MFASFSIVFHAFFPSSTSFDSHSSFFCLSFIVDGEFFVDFFFGYAIGDDSYMGARTNAQNKFDQNIKRKNRKKRRWMSGNMSSKRSQRVRTLRTHSYTRHTKSKFNKLERIDEKYLYGALTDE